MTRSLILSVSILCLILPAAAQLPPLPVASTDRAQVIPKPEVANLLISPDIVPDLHLQPNFVTAIRMPEPVRDVYVGAPGLFLAEHSDRDPFLVTVKPITNRPSTSNLFIATQSGQLISLRLISAGGTPGSTPIDFVVLYKQQRDFLIPSDDVDESSLSDSPVHKQPLSAIDAAFQGQQQVSSPLWDKPRGPQQPSKIAVSIGSVVADGDGTIVAFSVLNQGGQWVELLPPQIELDNPAAEADKKKKKKNKGKNVLADQLPITDYRYTARKFAPGQRVDGAVRFERPDFKQVAEQLRLELVTSDAVDRPLLASLPFTVPADNVQHSNLAQQEKPHERNQ